MAYRYYGLGQTEQTAAPKPPDGFTTDISTAYITPTDQASAPVVPSPTDIVPKPPEVSPSPVTPLSPLPPMTSPVTSSVQTAMMVGPFGISWRWWLLGGAALWFLRRSAEKPAVTPNRRRRRR